MYVKTTATFQIKVYRGCEGLSLKIPTSNAQIFGCLPIGSPLIKLWYAEIADQCAFSPVLKTFLKHRRQVVHNFT